jgi:hypothetical protein
LESVWTLHLRCKRRAACSLTRGEIFACSKKTSALGEAVSVALECSKMFADAGQGEAACETACLCIEAWMAGNTLADEEKTRMFGCHAHVLLYIDVAFLSFRNID